MAGSGDTQKSSIALREPMKKHFAFVSIAQAGHVNPTLPLVTELLSRGHRVTYAVGDKMASAVEETGAEMLPLPGSVFP
ncbi:hypothetical protein [Saccharopolyspora hattusasensis]|uniref:hypothetical protein n=1 Tax=Saccharopolyspora hattusasensis TaxID=1128679 RepID=UPI003D981E04